MDALDSIIKPLRPTLQSITTNLPQPLDNFALSLLGSTCHRRLLLSLDISSNNLECVKLGVSKLLGMGIVSMSCVVKVPQIINLIKSQSASGVSFLSYLLETSSFLIMLAYNVRSGFPFSTFGETAFIAVQDVVIAALILSYQGKNAMTAIFISGLAVAGFALFGQAGIVDMKTLGVLQAGAGLLSIASKVPQILTIWQQGSTGQLSAFAVFNYLIGSLVRIFTTLQEVDDKLILYGFMSGFVLNAVLAAQMVYYWNAPTSNSQKRALKQRKENDKVIVSKMAASPAGSTRSKTPSTRRRG